MGFHKRDGAQKRWGAFKRVTAAGVLGIAFCGQASAVTFDELRGYSIEFHNVHNVVWKHSQGRDDPISNDVHGGRQIYVSLAGRIFDYGELSAGAFGSQDRRVVAPDAAAPANRQRMIAWTIEGGNLVGISREIEGFFVRTVTVDLARMTCILTLTAKPDPATGRTVVMKLNGYRDEVVSMTTRSADCTIKRGNIFAADQ
jgi:hypothetical protein